MQKQKPNGFIWLLRRLPQKRKDGRSFHLLMTRRRSTQKQSPTDHVSKPLKRSHETVLEKRFHYIPPLSSRYGKTKTTKHKQQKKKKKRNVDV